MQTPLLVNIQIRCRSIAVLFCILMTIFGATARAQDSSTDILQPLAVPDTRGQDEVEPFQRPPESPNNAVEPRFQTGFPPELVLPPPSSAARQRERRFIESEVDPELPLSLVLGRPKILQLAAAPRRIYVPNDETISACLLYTSPSPRDLSTSRMPSSA